MKPLRGQSVADADRDVRQFLIRTAATLGEDLRESFIALYVYGSLATASYRRESSDIDLIAVVNRQLTPVERHAAMRTVTDLSKSRPTPGDIDIAIVQEKYASAFEFPFPYEFYYSSEMKNKVNLSAAIAETRERGIVLVGPQASVMFSPVPWHAYVAALKADFEWDGHRMSAQPMGVVLNACRILHGTSGHSMSTLNKEQAAAWALDRAPAAHRAVINDALLVYRGVKSPDDVVFHERDIAALREYVLKQAKPAFERASDGEDE